MIFKKYKTLSFPNSRFALSTLKNEKLHTSESPALQSILGADFHTPKNPKPITNRVNENLEQKLQKHKTTKTQKTRSVSSSRHSSNSSRSAQEVRQEIQPPWSMPTDRHTASCTAGSTCTEIFKRISTATDAESYYRNCQHVM